MQKEAEHKVNVITVEANEDSKEPGLVDDSFDVAIEEVEAEGDNPDSSFTTGLRSRSDCCL